ncbi:hypothetical protein CMI37_27940 [Candidatus Pacearchaeota archaeon]|nr:hypothetical protein [Candidatus Pacearchaeota archaeon]
MRAILYYIKMRKNKDCAVIQLRDDPTQKSGYIDGLSDADCHVLQDHIDKHDMPCKSTTVYSKDQVNANRKMHARWDAYTTGNAYVLYVQARTYDHTMRVQAYGKNAYQAVRRYYRGLDNACNHIWKCTKVIAVYSCADTHTAQAGDLLHGQAQDRAPW